MLIKPAHALSCSVDRSDHSLAIPKKRELSKALISRNHYLNIVLDTYVVQKSTYQVWHDSILFAMKAA